ncbi:MAG: biotin--[acetyl-CoA-carboxylase] ligase [Actinobacteria bacterium]|nr:biotin--[acetyl-CoA-carboxylase] ligase [Actinomycetota bacterium]
MASTDDNWQMSLPDDWQVRRVAETGSTNSDLFAQAENSAPHHSALLADFQSAGRGRLDRTWQAKAGANLLLSLLFRDSHVEIAQCQRRVAVAAVRASRKFFGTDGGASQTVKLKWPNDLLLGGTKFGGMLSVADQKQSFIVVGIGINIGWAPEAAAKLADLSDDPSLTPPVFLGELLRQISDLEKLSNERLHELYVADLATLTRIVQIEFTDKQVVVGRAVAVNPDGRLLVQTEQKLLTIETGDVVHLRDAGGE